MSATGKLFETIAQGQANDLELLLADTPELAQGRDANGVSAFMMAMYYGKAEMAGVVRQYLGELDLFEAATAGDTARVNEVIQDSSQVNSRSADGFTALHLACFFNQPPVVALLLQAGADVNVVAENPSKVQPLHSAIACQSVEIVKHLLAAGAQVNAAQHGGWTALQAAAKHGNRHLVEILLQHGADPRQQADDGQTAISMAVDDSIRVLLEGHR